MIIKVIKRDGRAVEYDRTKIELAILKANNDVLEEERISKKQIDSIIKYIENLNKKRMLVEDIQDIIETKLMEYKKYELAKAYIIYRYTRALVRKSNTTDETILAIIKTSTKDINHEQYNANTALASIQKDLIAKEVSRDLTSRILLPEEITSAHNEGVLYFHDMDYFLEPIFNSSLIDIKDMLDNGTVINGKTIESPKSFRVACTILTQIIAVAASSQYGSQTVDISVLGKYLRKSYEKIKNNIKEKYTKKIKDEYLDEIINSAMMEELKSGVQTIKYQINTLMTTTGKSPYVSLYLRLDKNDEYIEENALIIEEIFNQRIRGIKNEEGVYADVDYPKLIYVLDENNMVGERYDYLTKLAIKCVALRGEPSFISAKAMYENYGAIIPPVYPNHFLTSCKDEKGKAGANGRFNQGIVTINLVNIAISAHQDENEFIKKLEEVLDLCKEALLCKHYALMGTTSDVSPIHFKYGAIARLESKEKIDKLLKNNYSTITLGFVGLKEVVGYIKNVDIISCEGKEYALKIIKQIRTVLKIWQQEMGVAFSLCANYDKEVCEYFLKKDKEKYGIIKNITDKYAYSSAHFLEDELDVYEMLEYEKSFQKLLNGGTVSKINIDAISEDELISLIQYLYNNIVYSKFIKN